MLSVDSLKSFAFFSKIPPNIMGLSAFELSHFIKKPNNNIIIMTLTVTSGLNEGKWGDAIQPGTNLVQKILPEPIL